MSVVSDRGGVQPLAGAYGNEIALHGSTITTDTRRRGPGGVLNNRRWYSWILRLGHRLLRSISSEERDPTWKFQLGPRHKRLNLEALTDAGIVHLYSCLDIRL